MVACVGFSYLAYALVAMYVVVQNRAGALEIPLQGPVVINAVDSMFTLDIMTSVRRGYYLALATGAALVLSPLLLREWRRREPLTKEDRPG